MRDQKQEQRRQEIAYRTLLALEGLEDQDSYAGVRVWGLTIKVNPADTLIVIKAASSEGPLVGFVGSVDLATAFRKAHAMLTAGEVKFKEDEWEMRRLAEKQEDW